MYTKAGAVGEGGGGTVFKRSLNVSTQSSFSQGGGASPIPRRVGRLKSARLANIGGGRGCCT